MRASPARVFDAICDPATLLAVIPGCGGIERVGDEYRGTIAVRLPAFGGTFRTQVRLTEAEPPRLGTIEGEVAGAPGSVRGRATFELTPAGEATTTVAYEGRATISGPLARLDGRFAESLARSLIDQGLARLEARLAAAPPEAPALAGDPR